MRLETSSGDELAVICRSSTDPYNLMSRDTDKGHTSVSGEVNIHSSRVWYVLCSTSLQKNSWNDTIKVQLPSVHEPFVSCREAENDLLV